MGTGELKKRLELLSDRFAEGAERDRWTKAIESWFVRRKLAGDNATKYDEQFGKLLRGMDSVEDAHQIAEAPESWPWPTDQQVECGVVSRSMFPGRGGKRRVLWVFEGIESHLACGPADSTGIEIEHVMPRKPEESPPPTVGNAKENRKQAIRTMGNLTLVTRKLNRDLGNLPWHMKKPKLMRGADTNEPFPKLILELLGNIGEDWNEEAIQERGRRLAGYVCCVWPRATAS